MSLPNLKGRVAFVFDEDNFDIDQIVGVKYIKVQDLEELKSVAMKSFDPRFMQDVKPGDVLVGGNNFGYGHPHYPPMRFMRHVGVSAVIAESFAPLYFSIEISSGFPQICCPGITKLVERWDDVEVDWKSSRVINRTKDSSLAFEPHSARDLALLSAGGIVPWLKEQMNAPT